MLFKRIKSFLLFSLIIVFTANAVSAESDSWFVSNHPYLSALAGFAVIKLAWEAVKYVINWENPVEVASQARANEDDMRKEYIDLPNDWNQKIRLTVITGNKNTIADITQQKDAHVIVNAANATLLGGLGVDGAIHRTAGVKLANYIIKEYPEIRPKVRCEVGQMRETPAFGLRRNNIQFILHAVAPDCREDEQNVSRGALLRSCYEKCLMRTLELCKQHQNLRVVAFPSLSTGIFSYPLEEAAQIAVKTIAELIKKQKDLFQLSEIRFVVWPENFAAYQNAIKSLYS